MIDSLPSERIALWYYFRWQMNGTSYRRDRAFPAGLLLSGLYVLFRTFDLLDSLKNDPIEIENLRKMPHKFVPISKKMCRYRCR